MHGFRSKVHCASDWQSHGLTSRASFYKQLAYLTSRLLHYYHPTSHHGRQTSNSSSQCHHCILTSLSRPTSFFVRHKWCVRRCNHVTLTSFHKYKGPCAHLLVQPTVTQALLNSQSPAAEPAYLTRLPTSPEGHLPTTSMSIQSIARTYPQDTRHYLDGHIEALSYIVIEPPSLMEQLVRTSPP